MTNKSNIDYDLLIKTEKIRYQSDFSGAHWLLQVMAKYQELPECKMKDAYEKVLRIATKFGCKKALEKANEFNKTRGFPGFPIFLNLENETVCWNKISKEVINLQP